MSTDTLLTITGWTLITIGVAATVLLAVFRKRPLVRELLALPDPTPAVQDAIDDGDDFDAHVDQALAITNPAEQWQDRPHMHVVCGPCGGRVICFRDGAEAVEHLRSHMREAADLAAWEQEMTS